MSVLGVEGEERDDFTKAESRLIRDRSVRWIGAFSGVEKLVRPERSAGMKVSSVKKKLKEKAFAPGVNRDEVVDVEESIGLPLDEFLAVSIGGLQLVAPEIGL